MEPALLVDPDVAGMRTMLEELQIEVPVATSLEEVDWSALDVLVEATGRVGAGVGYATAALHHGVHVVMVSKEVESVAGVELRDCAEERGLRYLPAAGDQPGNLLRLLHWVEQVGLQVVAMGKSSEYDLLFDPASGTVTQMDQTIAAPELSTLIDMGPDVRATLDARARAVADLARESAADYCEVAVISQYTGATPDGEHLHYPVARPSELADVYSLREDGGLIQHSPTVDVFSALRLPGEASFAGGVFVIVRATDRTTWEALRSKGHVVSADGKYAAIFWPYHLIGVETPLSVLDAVSETTALRRPSHVVTLAGRIDSDLPAGTVFHVGGHHHDIEHVLPVIVPSDDHTAPFYLLDGARLNCARERGHLLQTADLDPMTMPSIY